VANTNTVEKKPETNTVKTGNQTSGIIKQLHPAIRVTKLIRMKRKMLLLLNSTAIDKKPEVPVAKTGNQTSR
jgi:hypothetical protein